MCWSPGADVVAGTVVAGLGVAVWVSARRGRDRVLGALPLLLGVHQWVESVVWWGLRGGVSPGVGHAATVVWAVIAMVVVPTLVPVGVAVAAWPGARVRLGVCAVVGVVVSCGLGWVIAARGVSVVDGGHVVEYVVRVGGAQGWWVAGYLMACLGAPLLSPDRFLRWFGVVAAAGALGCVAAWRLAFASTWCGFAAVLSVWLLVWVRRGPAPCAGAGPGAGGAGTGGAGGVGGQAG